MTSSQPQAITLDDLHKHLPQRPRDAHKGLFGHVLIIGGQPGMGGAVCLAGEAALYVGAGLVSVATHPTHAAALVGACPELMVWGIEQAADLAHLLAKATVIVLGPGLGLSNWSLGLFQAVLASSLPIVMDADGLNLLAEHEMLSEHWILTPHVGEAARLLCCPAEIIQTDRVAAVTQIQRQYGGVIVLKGAGSLVCTSSTLGQCSAGNPGMATGGMGDVLSGVIAGLLAQGLTTQQAAEFGVCLHATAGDQAAAQLGERGLLARDLMPHLRALVNVCNAGDKRVAEHC